MEKLCAVITSAKLKYVPMGHHGRNKQEPSMCSIINISLVDMSVSSVQIIKFIIECFDNRIENCCILIQISSDQSCPNILVHATTTHGYCSQIRNICKAWATIPDAASRVTKTEEKYLEKVKVQDTYMKS